MNMPPPTETYPSGRGGFDITRAQPAQDVLDLRHEYVTRVMRWLPAEKHRDDSDRYDDSSVTYHFARRHEDGSLIAAMRLTPVDSVADSLSFEMIAENETFQDEVARQQATLGEGKLWDLTRLVSEVDGRYEPDLVASSMVELFGMAVQVSMSQASQGEKAHWIFTTTPQMMRFFAASGITAQELGRGKLPNADGVKKLTFFCAVDVEEAVSGLRDSPNHQGVYRQLQAGVEGAIQYVDA